MTDCHKYPSEHNKISNFNFFLNLWEYFHEYKSIISCVILYTSVVLQCCSSNNESFGQLKISKIARSILLNLNYTRSARMKSWKCKECHCLLRKTENDRSARAATQREGQVRWEELNTATLIAWSFLGIWIYFTIIHKIHIIVSRPATTTLNISSISSYFSFN